MTSPDPADGGSPWHADAAAAQAAADASGDVADESSDDVDGELERLILAHLRDVPDYPSPGILFKDITPLLSASPVFTQVVDALAAAHAPGVAAEVDVVAGIEARGFIFGAPVAIALGLPFVPIRKRGKLPHTTVGADYDLEYGTATIEIHTDAVEQGQRVLLLDDVLATGGTAAAAAGLIERVGGIVTSVAFLLELTALAGRTRLPTRPLHILARA